MEMVKRSMEHAQTPLFIKMSCLAASRMPTCLTIPPAQSRYNGATHVVTHVKSARLSQTSGPTEDVYFWSCTVEHARLSLTNESGFEHDCLHPCAARRRFWTWCRQHKRTSQSKGSRCVSCGMHAPLTRAQRNGSSNAQTPAHMPNDA